MAETIDVSFTVLEETPARALSFLMGIARMPVVAAKLATRGWNADTHEQGWQSGAYPGLHASGQRSAVSRQLGPSP